MTTTQVMHDARELRRRHPTMPIVSAVRFARWREETEPLRDGETWQQDGYTMRVAVALDPSSEPDDGFPVYTMEWSVQTIPNPTFRGDSRRPGYGYPYVEIPCNPRTSRIKWNRDHGAARGVAVEIAEAEMRQDVERWSWDYGVQTYIVTVTAARAGVTLGSASMGGVDFGDDGDDGRYLREVAEELAPEAIDEAATTLRALCQTD